MAHSWLMQPVLAQVNFGGNPAALLGIALAVGGAGLYLLRSVRPQVARDYDIALSAVALLAGAILFFQGWRLDPILTFGSYLLAGAATFFAFETIRLRGATTEQAKRYTPMVDDERPVSRVYRAELDDMESVDERPVTRRIRASRDYRDDEDYGSVERRPSRSLSDRSSRSAPSSRRPSSGSRRPPSDRPTRTRRSDNWDEPPAPRYNESFWNDEGTDPDFEGQRSSTYHSGSGSSSGSSRSRRSRPPVMDNDARRGGSADYPSDYVDYQPIDYGDAEPDNSSNFD